MVNLRSIETELMDFLRAHTEYGPVAGPETDLIESSILDSLLVMDLLAQVEGSYGIALDYAEMTPDSFRTVGNLASLIATQQSQYCVESY